MRRKGCFGQTAGLWDSKDGNVLLDLWLGPIAAKFQRKTAPTVAAALVASNGSK